MNLIPEVMTNAPANKGIVEWLKTKLKITKEPPPEDPDKKGEDEGQKEKKRPDFGNIPPKLEKALEVLSQSPEHAQVHDIFARVTQLYQGEQNAATLAELYKACARIEGRVTEQEDAQRYVGYIYQAIDPIRAKLGLQTEVQVQEAIDKYIDIPEAESAPIPLDEGPDDFNQDDDPDEERIKRERPEALYAAGVKTPIILNAVHFDPNQGSAEDAYRTAQEIFHELGVLERNNALLEEALQGKPDDVVTKAELDRHRAMIRWEMDNLANNVLPKVKERLPKSGVKANARWVDGPGDKVYDETYAAEESDALAAGFSAADAAIMAREAALFQSFKNYIDKEHDPGSLDVFLEPLIPASGPGRSSGPPGTRPAQNELYKYLANPKNHRARDYLFHKILYKVLTQRNRTSRDLYDLEDRRDINTFMSFVRGVGKRVYDPSAPEFAGLALPSEAIGQRLPSNLVVKHNPVGEIRGRPLGDVLAEYYEVQQDAIDQSHDVDYWAGHAAGEMRQFQGSVAFYKNEYGSICASDPVINAAMHAYEQALLLIRDSHNGYIPPAAIGYDPNGMTYYWDHLAEDIFHQHIKSGVIRKVQRNATTGLPEQLNNRLILDPTNLSEKDLDDLEIKKVLKMAKGYGIVNMRLLEIFANSRGPGSDHPELGSGGFHSIPYEGLARNMQPMVQLMGKWKHGNVLYNYFFQQIIDPNGKGFNPTDVENIKKAATEGRLDELYPGAQRLIDQDNLTNFSGAFGPWTQWRLGDSMKGWSERDKEWLGGGIRVAMAKNWAQGRVDGYLESIGVDPETIKNPEGWDREKDLRWHSGPYQEWYEDGHHGGVAHGHSVAERLARAHNAMVWLQMVERNPLLVARNVKLRKEQINGMNVDVTLRHHIIDQLLSINLLQDDYTVNKSPDDKVRDELRRIAILEADVAAVRERLINEGPLPRTARLDDIIGPNSAIKGDYKDPDPAARGGAPGSTYVDADGNTWDENFRRQNVKKYFEMVHEEVTGTALDATWSNMGTVTQHIMEEIGVSVNPTDPTDRDIHINWANITGHDSDHHIQHHHTLEGLVFRDYNYLSATDDTSWRQLDLLNLGARQFLRRAGDLGSHEQGINELATYLNVILKGKPKMEDLVGQLAKARDAFMGDGADQAWKTGYLFAQATGRLFEARVFGSTWFADTFPGRIMMNFTDSCMAEKVYGHHHADNWTSNERRRWVDMTLDERILPPDALDAFGNRYEWNAHRLQSELHARDVHVIWETLTMGVAAAALLVLLTALLNAAKGEEGGGGHGGGHGH